LASYAIGQDQSARRLPEQYYQPFLKDAIAAVRMDDAKRAASLFRYFEESLPAHEVARDRAAVMTWLTMLRDAFGRVQSTEPIRVTSRNFYVLFVEAADPDSWNNSECLFKTYAVRTSFSDGTIVRRAEMFFTLCHDIAVRRTWLRSIRFQFPDPDPTTVQKGHELMRSWLERLKAGRPTF